MSTAIAPRSEYERLIRFIVASDRPFGLLAACVNDSRREAELREAARQDAAKVGREIAEVDVRRLAPEEDVVEVLARAVSESGAPVLFVRGIDGFFTTSESKHARALNLSRDRLPERLPARIVLWMSLEARTRLAQEAPDFSNVILSTLIFPVDPEVPARPMLHRFGEDQYWWAHTRSASRALGTERTLLAKLAEATDSSVATRIDTGLRIVEIDAAQGQIDEALARAEKLADLAFQHRLSMRAIDALELLADISVRTGRISEALNYQSQAHKGIEDGLLEEPKASYLRRKLARSYAQSGDIHAILGQSKIAQEFYERSLEIFRRLVESEPEQEDFRRDLSLMYLKAGDLYRDLGQGKAAQSLYEQALGIRLHLVETEPDRTDFQQDLSASYARMGDLLVAFGHGDAAREFYSKALEIDRRLIELAPDRADYQRSLSTSYVKVGDLYRDLGQIEAAREAYSLSLDIFIQLAESEPEQTGNQRNLAVSYDRVGDLYRPGQNQVAREFYERSLEIRRHLVEQEPDRADHQRELKVSFIKMGDLYKDLGQSKKAREFYEQSLEIIRRLVDSEPERADYQRSLTVSLERLGELQLSNGDLEGARRAFREAVEVCERLVTQESERADYQIDLTIPLIHLGMLEGHGGIPKVKRAIEILERLEAEGRLAESYEPWLIYSQEILGKLRSSKERSA